MIEIPAEGDHNKPEYIVWNANLDAAFTEVDKIVEFLFMTSEISPDALGMGKGMSDSGRALKLKLLRTIAKAKRKALYYDQGLKEIALVAQMLGKEWNITAEMDGVEKKMGTQIETPEVEFSEGVVIDTYEAAQEEEIRLRSGTTSQKDAIKRLDGVDDDTAEKLVKQIKEEEGLNLPLAVPGSTPSDPNANVPPTNPKQPTPPVPPVQPKGK